MPKKIPGMLTVEFIVISDDGTTESGAVRNAPGAVPFKTMRAVSIAIKKLLGEKDPEAPAMPPPPMTTTTSA